MDDLSECETTIDEDPNELREPPQRPDPTDRLTSENKCPNCIRKPSNQISRRYDTKVLDARVLSNTPNERENNDSELTKQFYSSSDIPSQEGNEINQQTEANSTNDVHHLEKQFKSSSDYPSQEGNDRRRTKGWSLKDSRWSSSKPFKFNYMYL